MPTSHGDYLDRAVKSLSKEMSLQVPVELVNSAAVKVRLCCHALIDRI